MRFAPLVFSILLLFDSFVCNVPAQLRSESIESRSGFTNVPIDQVRAMLSKPLTVQELELRLGKPAFKHSTNYGHIAYALPGRKSLSFGFKGNFVISARYDNIEITAVHPKIHNVLIQPEQRIPSSENQVFTLPGLYAFDDERFQTVGDLLKRITSLPRGSIAEFGFSCSGQNPSQEFIEEMKKACERNGITFIVHPAG